MSNGNNDVWVIVYRPSYTFDIKDDVLIKKVYISENEAERKLNGASREHFITMSSHVGPR